LVLAYGNDRKDLAHNAAASMKKVARPHREMETYTPDEIRRVLRTADKDRNGHLSPRTGRRRSHLAAHCRSMRV
jgi:hypothetical protein